MQRHHKASRAASADAQVAGASAAAGRAFIVQATFWSLALFALIRLAWVDRHLVSVLIDMQRTIVSWYGPAWHAGVFVDASCSGTDVMALCAAVTLSYPVAWTRRLAGAGLGITVLAILNMVRIATLQAAAPIPGRLELLHVYVWPVVLSLATVLYVLAWIYVGRRRPAHRAAASVLGHGPENTASSSAAGDGGAWRRFGWWALAMVVLYGAIVPWILTSRLVQEIGAWAATLGAAVLVGLGAAAQASGSTLITERGVFLVTQECLFTPVLPLGIAAACALPQSRRRRAAWLLAVLPIFFLLGVARLLLLALPPVVVASPLELAHGFYQLFAGGVAIALAARSAHSARRTAVALVVAVAGGLLAASSWTPLLMGAIALLPGIFPDAAPVLQMPVDPQGAVALLPGYQMGVVFGLWVALHGARRRRRLLACLGVVALSQVAFLLGAAVWTTAFGVDPHPVATRAWGLLLPLAAVWVASVAGDAMPGGLFAAAGQRGRPRGGQTSGRGDAYRRFWHGVGERFPSLTGAASTDYYFDNERRLIATALPALSGCRILKTDLWDEAKNTRILQWVAAQGAHVQAIDLSEPIARQARAAFADPELLRPAVGDVRELPFDDESFDAIYSMGTVEHFAETREAVAELARTLKPGGRLILGVPNRRDPFLRPLMVAVLYRLGLYGYGYEKSYSRRALRAMLIDAGLDVTLESGLLFMPGWVRMLDLWCHTRAPALAVVPRTLLRPFVWLDRRVPAVRRHGYLLASVGVKKEPSSARGPAPSAVSVPAVPGSLPGVEYVVDAAGCNAEALRTVSLLQQLFAEIIADLQLHPAAPAVWHVFPGGGGVTGMVLLSESHLSIHTYPEAEFAAVNLYCCRESAAWPWAKGLRRLLGAREVAVRVVRRGDGGTDRDAEHRV